MPRAAVTRQPTPCSKGRADHITSIGGNPACKRHKSEKRGGDCCKQPPTPGLSVCFHHGGARKDAREAGRRRVAEQVLMAAARDLIPGADERTPITNPLERLLELAAEADGLRESLRLLANDLTQIRYEGKAGGEQLRAEVATYMMAFRDLTNLLIAIGRLDIEKTLARITVAQAEQSMAAMRAGMDEAGIGEEQKRAVMAGVGRHLRAVAS